MSIATPPTFEEYVALTDAAVSADVPETVVYNVSGSRRAAFLAGVPTDGDAYAAWCREGMLRCLDVLFNHGVKNVLMPAVTPGLFSETTSNYREHLWRWIEWVFATDPALAEFDALGWNVNIIFSEYIPELEQAHKKLATREKRDDRANLWVIVTSTHNQMMEWMLRKLEEVGPAGNSQEAIEILYGASIPPAELYLDFGKPIVSVDVVPPFLNGIMHCYWTQQPGYSLTREGFRSILYDWRYVRKTWQADKSGRTADILQDKDEWQQKKIIGLGKKLGPYWYPID